ncbi:MAG: hypothetical protein RLZZ546_2903 [Bacteroidota bacterium]|jgi:23S rRNA (cytosine1962-C5)-methyltransferase
MYPEISLAKGREQSVHRHHPWIFSGAIKSKTHKLSDGEIVRVLDYAGNFLAVGIYQNGSIMVRILTKLDIEIDQNFWDEVILNAYMYRTHTLLLPSKATNAYRLFHGEGDGVSGLVIDIYNKTAVIQCHNIGIYKMLDYIIEALKKKLPSELQHIYVKSKETLPDQEIEIKDGHYYGTETEEDIVSEYNLKFKVNWASGQKTGFFLDQRENRKLVGENANGKSVLNCFCYTGGFSVYAAANGATKVDSVDISAKAMAITDENILINRITNHQSHTANVLDFLSNHISSYDIVIVDPPAFAKSMSKRHNAVQAYKRLNILAMKVVKKGGLLFTFSCSQVVNTQLFYDTIVSAGIESGRKIRVMQHLSQGADHPVHLFHPEGHYLKGLILYVE